MVAVPSPDQESPTWPRVFRIPPLIIVILAIAMVVAAWFAVFAVDIWGWLPREGAIPIWMALFNEGLVEIAQWIFIALFVVGAGYLAGMYRFTEYAGIARFYLVLSIGFAFILIEEAGDVRLILAEAIGRWYGYEILGFHYHVVGTLPVMAFLAFFPVYALVRYGRHVWQCSSARWYLVAMYGIYAGSQLGAQTSHIEGWYAHFGNWLNINIFGSRLPEPWGMEPGEIAYLFIDNVVEESLELIAAGALFAMLLATISDLRKNRVSVRVQQDMEALQNLEAQQS
ncbi:hypothetical protein IEU95_12835 [Hoyosella rhizosphaerae]|uniref:Uncharacterized protein n=1 Tax=Hoyosella rhizosphaerae TaxID=1755582 RepID=A0A916U632_9ACTN|nr:hypothetical protein [Hoyosella rhizosphaerae]MBN4927722.1 hypothetical protein [Hoyosella rhizosphaerae]GGC62091.1 hypothetical protein GCM10011410_13210 [Hoyosella rhizosphaerae]